MTQKIDDSIQQGETLFQENRVREAEELFTRLHRKYPENAQILNNLGAICNATGQKYEAERYFLQALEVDPDHRDALINLSSLYGESRRWREAAVQMERFLETEKNNTEVLNQLAVFYVEAGNHAQAITTLKRSLTANPRQPDISTALNDLEKYATLKSTANKNQVLHVMISSPFMPPFIEFVDKHFGRDKHRYVFVDKERYEYGLTPEHGVEFLHTVDGIFITLLDYMNKADKIILHGLWRTEVDILLYFNQDLLKKCYWIMWGGDFYFPERHTAIRKQIIRKMGHAVNNTIGDYELIRKWYGTKAEHHKCFAYLSNTFRDYRHLKIDNKKNSGNKTLLIGNSADPTNNHFDILDKIRHFRDDNIEVICPLSYGDNAYAEKVLHAGKAIFDDKF